MKLHEIVQSGHTLVRVNPRPFPTTNPDIRIANVEVLSDNWYTLRRVDFDHRDDGGRWVRQQREAYDRGNGATVLLVDWGRRTVLLTRQFRIPAYLNGHPDGMLIETAAGLLDDDDAETAIRREAEEETGCRIGAIAPLFELFMSPGSVTERVAFFVAEYQPSDRVGDGGGLAEEGENIEVIEVGLDQAYEQIESGAIVDAKTVLLLQWARLEEWRSGSGLG
jgi:nudix-type nucleoside diphosphatase (YffH/AdpP family)